jgi:hypothetical protein
MDVEADLRERLQHQLADRIKQDAAGHPAGHHLRTLARLLTRLTRERIAPMRLHSVRVRSMMPVATAPEHSTVAATPRGSNSAGRASVMPTTANPSVW